jgi:hypothetical protein
VLEVNHWSCCGGRDYKEPCKGVPPPLPPRANEDRNKEEDDEEDSTDDDDLALALALSMRPSLQPNDLKESEI